jgi:D-lactate dehydrogenase (cytochrome)
LYVIKIHLAHSLTDWLTSSIAALFFLGVGYTWSRITGPKEPSKSSTTTIREAPKLEHDTRPYTLQAVWGELVNIVGKENVITAPADMESHSTSSWSTHPALPEHIPFMVVKPESTEQVSQIMKICHERKVPITPYSGGTSLEGQFTPTRGGVCIDFNHMNKIITLHPQDLDVIVQPGVGWEILNEELGKSGLMFPPDPGPGAQIGGMIGTGCSGTNAYRYGTMKDWVLGLTVVLADGTIIKTRQRPRKSSAGYDLTRMFVGSEGTLGLVTEATLKVMPKPEKESVAVCAFGNLRQATEAVFQIASAGVPVAAVEILDDVQMRCINEAGMTSRHWAEAPTLFFKFAGTPAAVNEHIGITKQIAKKCGSKSFEFARNKSEAEELWSARKEALWSVTAQSSKPGHRVWTTDVAVPLSQLPQIIEETQLDIRSSGLLGSILGHVGDGNFHSIILYDSDSPAEKRAVESVVKRMVDRALEMEGTATGEHGVGLVKRKYLEKELGPDTINLMRKLKVALDPLCLLNCDKVVVMGREKGHAMQDMEPSRK